MRAADAIEKITTGYPNYLQRYKTAIIQLCDKAENKELKWHLALLVSRHLLSPDELEKVWQMLLRWATDKNESRIVRVNCLQGLFDLSTENKELRQDFSLKL